MKTQRSKIIYITQAALIAAIYTVLTLLAAGFDLASGAIQVRFSEALTIMPFFTPAAIPGPNTERLFHTRSASAAKPKSARGQT